MDHTGHAAGVERQEAECRQLAKRLELDVTHILVDNSISAYSGKPRPQYTRLLELMRAGEIGCVLSFHQDRLQRSPIELEEYLDASDAGHVDTHTVLAGFIDLSTPAGRFNARIVGAAARYEVEHMIERQKAAKLDAARQGKFLGSQRPFGFEPRREGIREDEAAILRDMARKVIDGFSFRTIAVDLNQREILTQHGKPWNALKVRNVLIRPINAGIVRHEGIDYEAESPAILSRDEWDALNAAIIESRQRSTHPGQFRTHLLSGFLFCGICGQRMYPRPKKQRRGPNKPQFVCRKINLDTGMETRGCGKVARMSAPIVDLVTESILYRLDSPELAQEIEQQKSGSNTIRDLVAHQRALEGRLSEINNDYYIAKVLDRDEFANLRKLTKDEIAVTEQQIKKASSSVVLKGIDLGADIRATWNDATLEWRRDVMSQLIEKVYVHPKPQVEGYRYPGYRGWRFDPELIEIRWKA